MEIIVLVLFKAVRTNLLVIIIMMLMKMMVRAIMHKIILIVKVTVL